MNTSDAAVSTIGSPGAPMTGGGALPARGRPPPRSGPRPRRRSARVAVAVMLSTARRGPRRVVTRAPTRTAGVAEATATAATTSSPSEGSTLPPAGAHRRRPAGSRTSPSPMLSCRRVEPCRQALAGDGEVDIGGDRPPRADRRPEPTGLGLDPLVEAPTPIPSGARRCARRRWPVANERWSRSPMRNVSPGAATSATATGSGTSSRRIFGSPRSGAPAPWNT